MPGSLFDTNVWIASVFTTHPAHRSARGVLKESTSAEPAVFCRSTHQSFLRLASTPALAKVYGATGMTNRDALHLLEGLLALPQVCHREESPGTVEFWHQLAARDTASPKVWMDAYLAALAIRGGMRLVSLDRDFKTFETHGLDLQLLHF